MVGYVIAYTIVLLLISCIIVFFFAYQNKKLKLNQSIQKEYKTSLDEKIFLDYLDESSEKGYLIIKVDNKEAIYASKTLYNFFGIQADSIKNNVYLINNALSSSVLKSIQYHIDIWENKNEPMVMNFEIKNVSSLTITCRMTLIIKEYENERVCIVQLENITKLLQKEKETKEKMDELILSGQTKMNYLSNMSHEIRTPMNGIIGMVDLAKSAIDDKKTVFDYLSKAEDLSEYLLSLINDILDISKLESGKFVFAKEEVDLRKIAEKLDNMFSKTIREKGIHYSVTTEGLVSPFIIGDELRIMQIMINFISNASKFTKTDKTIDVLIKQIGKEEKKGRYLLQVKDTGKGMSKEFLGRIFHPFEQESATTAKKHGGTGLGMAITDNLVRLMGGKIIVDSELGVGSTFSVFLTFETSDGKNLENSSLTHSVVKEKSSYHILLAEDNEINALVALKALSSLEVKVDRAHDGLEALNMFKNSKENDYDLVLMDIQMPNMDGYEATRAIRRLDREDAKSLLIVALSADAMTEDKLRSIEAGMNGHYSKPTNYKKLVQELLFNRK